MAGAKILFENGASSALFTDRREFYPEPQLIYSYWKNIFPWLTIMSKLPTKKVPDPLYKLFEDTPTAMDRYFRCNGSAVTIAANGDESAAITVDGINNLASSVDDSYEGLICEIWNSDWSTKKGSVIITDAASTTTIKCKTMKAAAITTADNDWFMVTTNVRGEKSVAGTAYSDELSVVRNSTHYLSKPVEVTGKLYKEAKLKGASDELGRLRNKRLFDMKMDFQEALLRSVSTVGTNMNGSDTFTEANLRTVSDSAGNSSVARTTYGYIPILEDYGVTWSGTGALASNTNIFKSPLASLKFDMFADWSKVIFDKRDTDMIFGLSGYGAAIGIAKKVHSDDKAFGFKGKVQLGDQKFNTLGFMVRELTTPAGTVQLVMMKSLRNQYENTILLPNISNIGIAEYEPWQYKSNIKTDDDYNGVKDVFNYDAGLWMTQLPTHHMLQFSK